MKDIEEEFSRSCERILSCVENMAERIAKLEAENKRLLGIIESLAKK